MRLARPAALTGPITLAALALAAMTLAGCVEQGPEPQIQPRPIAWTTVEEANAPPTRTLSGVVRAIQRAPLSFEVPGRIDSLAVEIGDSFGAGDVLGRLDPRTFELALTERLSELAEAQANLTEAESEFERQRQLFEDGWVSRAGYDRALAALETARSRVHRVEAAVEIAREDLADTLLLAPYDGVVRRRFAEPAQQMAAGQPVFDIQGNSAGLEVVVSVPETLVDQLASGSWHRVSLPADGFGVLDAVITEIGAEATANNAFPVTLVLLDTPAGVRAGMTVEVALALDATERQDGLIAIPVTAFLAGPEAQGQVAFVYDQETGTVARRTITVADITGEAALVANGLQPGDVVATAGLAFLVDGQPVTLLGEGPDRYNM